MSKNWFNQSYKKFASSKPILAISFIRHIQELERESFVVSLCANMTIDTFEEASQELQMSVENL